MTATRLLLVSLLLCTLTAPLARADEPPDAAADAMLDEGTRLFTEDADYDAALSRFQDSYKLRPSWKALNGIALVYTQQGKYVEAIETYERLITEFGPTLSEGQASTVKKRMSDLEGRVGAVDVVVDQEGALVSIDGRELGRGPYKGRLRLLPGQHTLTATLEGYRTFTQKITVEPGGQVTLEVKLSKEEVKIVVKEKPVRFERKLPSWVPWATMGAGVALAVGGGGLHAWAASDFDDFDQSVTDAVARQLMPGGSCYMMDKVCSAPGDLSLKDAAEAKQVAAISMYVTGGVLVTGGLVLLFVNRPRPVYEQGAPESGAVGARPRVDVQPWIGPGVAGLGIAVPW